MDSKRPLISYSLATMAGICFVSGIAILSNEGRIHNAQTRGSGRNAR
jgi:hypothetical protein